jgi:hypothetical protein
VSAGETLEVTSSTNPLIESRARRFIKNHQTIPVPITTGVKTMKKETTGGGKISV